MTLQETLPPLPSPRKIQQTLLMTMITVNSSVNDNGGGSGDDNDKHHTHTHNNNNNNNNNNQSINQTIRQAKRKEQFGDSNSSSNSKKVEQLTKQRQDMNIASKTVVFSMWWIWMLGVWKAPLAIMIMKVTVSLSLNANHCMSILFLPFSSFVSPPTSTISKKLAFHTNSTCLKTINRGNHNIHDGDRIRVTFLQEPSDFRHL